MDNTCTHRRIIGDNYGESCRDCGAQLGGYGYGGWFGSRLTGTETCIHLWSSAGDGPDAPKVCVYCQEWRETTPA